MLRALFCVGLIAIAGAPLADEDQRALFTDPQDGALDASEWLLDKKGFLPVPIVITEPAVGYGAGAALVFFRESLRERAAHVKPGEALTPPDIYVAAVAATENGTKLIGGGGLVTFDEDRWRWRGFVGLPDVNLDFYGVGGQTGTGERKIAYNVDGVISTQQLFRRIGQSNSWVVGRWIWLDLDATFDASRSAPVLPAMFYSPDWGSDNKYQTYRAQGFGYVPLSERYVLGGRADARAANGDVPFYQLPFIELRGVPVARYQDQRTAVVETELRWNVTPRWALVGFGGVGRAWGTRTTFSDAGDVKAWGAGFRYLVARRLGLLAGIDVARGPENTAFYIQAGSAWR